MNNLIGRLRQGAKKKRGLLVFLLALIVSLSVVRMANDGIPFIGGGGGENANVTITELTTANFGQELSKASGPIFVALVQDDADSRAARVIVQEAGKSFVGKISFYTVDVNKQPQITQMFQSVLVDNGLPVEKGMPIPLYILFTVDAKTGEPVLLNVGASVVPTSVLKTFFEDGLSGKATAPVEPTAAPADPSGGTAPSAPAAPASTPAQTSPSTSPTASPKSGR